MLKSPTWKFDNEIWTNLAGRSFLLNLFGDKTNNGFFGRLPKGFVGHTFFQGKNSIHQKKNRKKLENFLFF